MRMYDPPAGWRYGFPKEYKDVVQQYHEENFIVEVR